MTADLFFMPTVPQNPPPSIQCDKTGSFSTGSWSKTNTSDLSKGDKSENFLNALQKASTNPNASDGPQRPSLNPPTQSEKADGQLKTKEETNSESSVDELLAALISRLQNDEAAVSDQTPISADLKELIDLLETLGLVAPSGETTLPAGERAGDQNLSGPAGNPQSGILTLKQLIIGIRANDNMPSNDMSGGWERLRLFISNALGGETSAQSGGDSKADLNLNQNDMSGGWERLRLFISNALGGETSAQSGGDSKVDPNLNQNDMSGGWERLRLFISNALGGETSAQSGGDSKADLNLNQTVGSAQLAHGAKEIAASQESLKSVSGVLTGEGSGSEKTSDILSAMNRTAAETAVETQNTSKETGTLKSAANSQIPLESENSEKTDGAKLHPDNRTAADQTSNIVKENKFPYKVASDAPKVDAEPDIREKTEASNRTAELSRLSSAAGSGQRSGGEPAPDNPPAAEASSVSKLINDAQVEKEHPLKATTTLTDDSGGKVVKMEAGTNDSSQLTSQTQTSQKAFEMATAAKESEAGQSALRNQPMEQIVRRAVVLGRDGLHEARIDLKPEFLGHVRMQVITENQQVTVKILTEFGFVKDMIENNIHQLKADLQQHGLEVDKVDVSVSRDADGNKHSQQNAERAKNQQHETDNTGGDNTRKKNQEPKERAGLTADGFPTVDYFA